MASPGQTARLPAPWPSPSYTSAAPAGSSMTPPRAIRTGASRPERCSPTSPTTGSARSAGRARGTSSPTRDRPDRPRLVPELICSDLARSRGFYTGVLGFRVLHERPAERFAHLEREGAEIMLEQPLTHDRLFPSAELSQPYGRGMNLEIDVDDVAPLH